MLCFATRIYIFKSLYFVLIFLFIVLESEEWHLLIFLLMFSCFGRNQDPFQNSWHLSFAWSLFMQNYFICSGQRKKNHISKAFIIEKWLKKWKVVIVSYYIVLQDFRSKQTIIFQISGIFRSNTLLQVHLCFSPRLHCLRTTECLKYT